MLVVMRDHASAESIDHVVEILHEHGAEAHLSRGEVKTIIGVIGEREIIYTLDLEGVEGVRTESHGEGPDRRVQIIPVKAAAPAT